MCSRLLSASLTSHLKCPCSLPVFANLLNAAFQGSVPSILPCDIVLDCLTSDEASPFLGAYYRNNQHPNEYCLVIF